MRTIMSNSTTFNLHGATTSTASAAPSKPSILQRLIAARMRRGKARVSGYLARQSDVTLADLGFTADQIAAIRKTGEIPTSFWR